MKKLIMLLIIFSIQLFSQSQFPIGIYINTYGPQDRLSNYSQIDSLGVNYIIEQTDSLVSSIGNINFNVIPCNGVSDSDYVYNYTSGMLKTWEAEEIVLPGQTGLKTEIGKIVGNEISSPPSDSISKIGKYLLTGPDYIQYSHYGGGFSRGRPVNYDVEFRIRIEEESKYHLPVCSLEVSYLKNDTLRVFADTILYADELFTDFSTIKLSYQYPFKSLSSDIGFRQRYPLDTIGIKFNVIWLGNEKVFVDFIRVYDQTYGKEIVYNFPSVSLNINKEISKYNYSNIKYFYSFDEPHSLDNYEPYKIVDNIVQSTYTDKAIITAMYPEWDGYRDRFFTIPKFQREVNPKKVMYYYYPFGLDTSGIGTSRSEAFYNQANLFVRYHSNPNDKMNGSFWFVGQSCSFYSPGEGYNLRRLTATEMLGSTMLALANGANGIFYWEYYSALNNNGTYRIHGIVELENGSWYPHTDLFYMLRDNIIPRLKGNLGNNLLSSKYEGNYIWKDSYHLSNENQRNIIDYLSFEDIINTNYNYYAGLLKDTVDNLDEFLLINLMDTTRGIGIRIDKPYKNVRLKNIETSFDLSFYDSLVFYDTIQPGDGHLYKLFPAVKYGGTILGNETVSSGERLLDNLEISNNKILTIGTNYYLNDTLIINSTNNINLNTYGYIIPEDGGKVVVNSYGPLARLKTTNNHPWIVWGEYTLSSPIYYKVFRSIGGGSWTLVDTTSLTEYVDTTVTIVTTPGQQGTASYYIIASKINKPLAVKSDTIIYTIYGGLEKEGNEAALRYEYNLEQNYPNPFNPQTTISYELKEDCFVSIKIYDLLGNQVKELVNENKSKGRYSINLDINNLNISSGIYFYTINAGKYIDTKKMVILK
ncbi:MAG TPA: T9SS type A sorting domain-containing protein [Ignavibacteriaceae bacterium]|nr:T9SS type A sorting domain-containing protein [Ignavibacteriaceae bacterium]